MADETIEIEASVADFPAGVKMTPGQFAQWLVENITFTATGAFLTGQIGGTRPSSNVGLFLNGRRLEVWDGAAYASLLTPPIGAMFGWPSALLVPPDDYLFCDGQLILKTDFPLLRDVINDAFKATGDDSAFFRLPSTAGRVLVGKGTGDYNPTKASGVQGGNMIPRTVGGSSGYFGAEWPEYKVPVAAQAPASRYLYVPYQGKPFSGNKFTSCLQPSVTIRWLIRSK